MVQQALELPIGFGYFVRDLFRSRHLIFQLSLREFRARYLGSALGMIWALLHPLTMIAIYWFVFQFALPNPDVGHVPFILWLMAGLVPFMFLSESIGGGVTAILDNGYLVKKVVFRINMLPVVRLLALTPLHAALVTLLLVVMAVYRLPFNLYTLQVVYYFFAGCCLCLGISFLTASLMPFLRDTVQFISVIMQILFWLTPIIWPITKISDLTSLSDVQKRWLFCIFAANPFYYIVQGYRESLLGANIWFWRHWALGLYFWGVTLAFMVVGMLVFKRLRPHFADVV